MNEITLVVDGENLSLEDLAEAISSEGKNLVAEIRAVVQTALENRTKNTLSQEAKLALVSIDKLAFESLHVPIHWMHISQSNDLHWELNVRGIEHTFYINKQTGHIRYKKFTQENNFTDEVPKSVSLDNISNIMKE